MGKVILKFAGIGIEKTKLTPRKLLFFLNVYVLRKY